MNRSQVETIASTVEIPTVPDTRAAELYDLQGWVRLDVDAAYSMWADLEIPSRWTGVANWVLRHRIEELNEETQKKNREIRRAKWRAENADLLARRAARRARIAARKATPIPACI